MPEDIATEYAGYLRRFEAALGALEPGEFAKHNGKLIQKLAFAEFEPVYKEYMGLASHYLEGLDRGDTVNDLVVKLIREHAAKLILTSPV